MNRIYRMEIEALTEALSGKGRSSRARAIVFRVRLQTVPVRREIGADRKGRFNLIGLPVAFVKPVGSCGIWHVRVGWYRAKRHLPYPGAIYHVTGRMVGSWGDRARDFSGLPGWVEYRLTKFKNSSNLDEMKTVSANRAKQTLGQVLDAAQREPVMIQRHNRPAAVVLSPHEYERLRGLNVNEFSAFCDRIGRRAAERGLTGEKLDAMVAEE